MSQAIKIMGAGPAGLTAAITLARAGRSVVVYERAHDVGTRHDGDYEGIENWTTPQDVWVEFTRWGLVRNFHCTPFCEGTLIGPGFHETLKIKAIKPLLYFVTRGAAEGSFDQGLLEQARTADVRVEFDHPVRAEDVDIVAGGFSRARAFAVGYNFKTSTPNGIFVCVDDALTPKAYSYLILCEGEGTIAACAFKPQSGMKEILPHVIEGFHSRVQFDMNAPKYFAASIGFDMPKGAQKNAKPYVGEAGGFQDYIAGFGMRMGMTTGYLAACSLLHGMDFDRLWRARYASIIQAAEVNRWLLELAGNRGYSLVLRYVQRHDYRAHDLLRFFYLPNWHTRLLGPFGKRIFEAKLKRTS